MEKLLGDLILFKKELEEFLKDYEKLVILGVGNELKCDDGAGSFIVNSLSNENLENDNLILIDGSTVPENYTGKIKKEDPSHLLIIDACLMDEEAGTIKIVNRKDFGNIGISTHSMSLSYFIRYLERDSSFKILFLGIEPKSMVFSNKLTRNVENSCYKLINLLKSVL